MWINWALLGDGEHVVVAYDDGVAFARSTFTVGTTGEAFLEGVIRRTVIDDFPEPGQRASLEWNEGTQHFEIARRVGERRWPATTGRTGASTMPTPRRAPTRPRRTCTPRSRTWPPALAGRLTQAARNRALEAANQIRDLHGLPPVRWNSSYSRQAQEAALIQAANDFLEPSARCGRRVLQRGGG